MRTHKTVALILALLLAFSLFGGCSKTSETPSSAPEKTPAGSSSPASTSPESGKEEDAITFPLADGYTFDCWWPLDNNLTTVIQTMAEHPYFVEMKKRTGVEMNFTHPVMGSDFAVWMMRLRTA